jgi:hypothetical protein
LIATNTLRPETLDPFRTLTAACCRLVQACSKCFRIPRNLLIKMSPSVAFHPARVNFYNCSNAVQNTTAIYFMCKILRWCVFQYFQSLDVVVEWLTLLRIREVPALNLVPGYQLP